MAIGVSVAAVAYTAAVRLTEEEQAPAEIGFVESRGNCLSILRVASAEDADWNDLRIVVEGAQTYGIDAAGHLADDEPWSGDALRQEHPVRDGDVLRIGVADEVERVRVRVVDVATDSVPYRGQVDVVSDDGDPSGSLALDDGATVGSLSTVDGDAADGCSGAATTRVTVQRADGAYLSPDGYQDDPHVYEGDGSDWTADVPDDELTEDEHTIRATPVDRAGREGATEEVTVTYDPDVADAVFDPGHAYEDVDNDGRYTDGTDVRIPDPEIHDGEHVVTDPPYGLVIPPSVGDVSADRITFDAGSGGHLVVDVDLESTDERIELTGGTSTDVAGIRIDGGAEYVNVTAGTTLDASDAHIDSDEEDVELDAGGDVDVTGATLTSGTQRVEVTAGGVLSANATEMTAVERVDLRADGDVWIESARLDAETVLLDAGQVDRTLHVEGGELVADGPANGDPDCVSVDGTPASGSVDRGC